MTAAEMTMADLGRRKVELVNELNRALAAHRISKTPETTSAVCAVQEKLSDIKHRMSSFYGEKPECDMFQTKRELIGALMKWRDDLRTMIKNPAVSPAEKLFSERSWKRLTLILGLEKETK